MSGCWHESVTIGPPTADDHHMMTTSHVVAEQRRGVADHAAPDDRPRVDPTAIAQYASTLLPGVLWLLGVYVFDGAVPAPLHGGIGLLVTAACTLAVRWARRI